MDKLKNLSDLLNQVEKPARYIGSEENMVVKNHNNCLTKMAFCFPDLYEIGMSYMGLQILYNCVNKVDNLVCERVFEPGPDMAKLLEENKIPYFTLETKTPIKDMDVIGFTLQYEMSFTNILHILDLGQVTLKARERGEDEPLVIAGGPCAYNPEPLADFIDVFLIGDGEYILPKLLEDYGKSKKKGISKKDFLKSVSKDEGIYVPSLYEPVYNDDNTIKEYKKLYEHALDRVKRALIDDIEKVEFPTKTLVPYIETVHNRAVVETFRGCTRGCRFCQAGMIYRPVRERKTETIKDLAIKQLDNTGHEELSLLSLSTSDYSDFEELATSLMDECGRRNVSLSLPSLRLDTFSFRVLEEIQKYKKSGLTFAPEAGSQRLRDVINKGIWAKDIYDATSQAIDLGWRNIKLYFMCGLPTETEEDLDGIGEIASNIVKIFKDSGKGGRFNVTVSVSNFVPKGHTPFQWMGQNTIEEFREKHNYLKSKLKIKGVTFNYHDADISVLEAVLARGDRRVGELIYQAYKKGCRLDGWSEHFKLEKWMEAMEDSGITKEFYAFRERNIEEFMPWDIIDSSISKSFLIREWEKAKAETITHDCRYGCVGCGINRRTVCKQGGIYEQ